MNSPTSPSTAIADPLAHTDWRRSPLGAPAQWPHSLRLTVDIMLNCPAPMALLWGREQVMLYNGAYAELSGAPAQSVPGGKVPSLRPAVWSWNEAALEAAWAGQPSRHTGQALPFWLAGAVATRVLDLYYTPVRDADGAVPGILCTLQPAEVAESAIGPAEEADGTGLRILVVEDNPDAQYLVCEMLRALGHTVDAAARGDAALAMLDGFAPDVLFTDVGLPGMSGIDLARIALARRPTLRIVFASGYGAELTRHLEFPAASMQKPYEIDQLRAVLAAAAQARSAS